MPFQRSLVNATKRLNDPVSSKHWLLAIHDNGIAGSCAGPLRHYEMVLQGLSHHEQLAHLTPT